jgi:mycothiol system anti-sigma-R factor
MATDCQGTLDELERFLDQELPSARRDEVMDHLRRCTDCQQAFDFHGELKRVVREKAQKDELPPQLMDKILGCFGEEWLAG